ncbi:MAG: hypothetical protein JWM95_52 [Gemmatimonadetes bacterium]|nr:hypothetical protein [Gemmatimonadota bacterium]
MANRTRSQYLLEAYFGTIWDQERIEMAAALLHLGRTGDDPSAIPALLYVLNSDKDSDLRLAIVELLHARRVREAVPDLAKALFDADGRVRSLAAEALAEYADPRLLASALPALLQALSDPATRDSAQAAVKTISGKSADKITPAERERLRIGDSAQAIWRERFAPPADGTGA